MGASSYSVFSIKRMLFPLLAQPRVKQAIKWTVYVALFINFGFYIRDDLVGFNASLGPDAVIWDLLEAFTTSIDMAAWLMLLVVLEFETYVLSEEAYTPWLERGMLLLRVVCYLSIASAAWGYLSVARDYHSTVPVEEAESVCELADQGLFQQLGVIEYEEITTANCESLPAGGELRRIPNELAIIDSSSLPGIQFLSWIDVINGFVWILVVLLIEVEIQLQWEDRFASRLLRAVRMGKTLCYAVLIGNGIVWLFTGYYLYTWDAFLWIFGFWAIELNLAEWEMERVEQLQEKPS